MWYTCPQLPKSLQKYDKSGNVADTEEPDTDIEATIGDIEEPPINTERPDTSTEASFLGTQETVVEPPAKRFRQNFFQKLVKNSYFADDEYALESTAWQNDTSGSFSDWERLSKFSDTGMDPMDDVSGWEL